jgi:hypothetical protein
LFLRRIKQRKKFKNYRKSKPWVDLTNNDFGISLYLEKDIFGLNKLTILKLWGKNREKKINDKVKLNK